MVFTISAVRYVHSAKSSGPVVLASGQALTEGEAGALAIELADTNGAEAITITRPSWGDYFGLVPAYFRLIDLCPIVWDGTETWR